MRNELRQHKKSDAVKWIIVFACVILLAVAVTAAITQGFTNWNPWGWFDEAKKTGETVKTAAAVLLKK